jgi:hypothetical protein
MAWPQPEGQAVWQRRLRGVLSKAGLAALPQGVRVALLKRAPVREAPSTTPKRVRKVRLKRVWTVPSQGVQASVWLLARLRFPAPTLPAAPGPA